MIDGVSQTNDDKPSANVVFIGSNAAHVTQTTTDSASATQDRRHSSRLPTVYVAISNATLTPNPSGEPTATNSTTLTTTMAVRQASGRTRRPTRRRAVTAYNKDCTHSGPWRCVDPMPNHTSSWPSTPTTAARAMSKAQFLRLTSRRYCWAGGLTSSLRRTGRSS